MTELEKPDYKWQPITDLPENWRDLRIRELSSLAAVWAEQRVQLQESQALKQFNERLMRQWSIETGILERIYTLDRGVTQALIEQGIDAALVPHWSTDVSPNELVLVLQDHCEAVEGLFDFVASRQELTISFIRQLHQVLTQHQDYADAVDQFGNVVRLPLECGGWKKLPNNPTRPDGTVHEYCPPEQVVGEMERLVAYYASHEDVPPEVEGAWLHHRFTQIHPFQDGNGRVARALATIVFLRAGWFPLVVTRDQRAEYLSALETADRGDLGPLVKLFGHNAKNAFARALSLSDDVLGGERVLTRVVSGLADLYETRRRLTMENYQRVEAIADELVEDAYGLLEEVEQQIKDEFSEIPSPPRVHVARNRKTSEHYYTAQIISVAQDLDYWANVSRRRDWVRLHLVNGQKTQIVFSFHYLGKRNRGVMVCTGFVYFPESKTDAESLSNSESEPEVQFGETHRICAEPFYFSYQDENRQDELKTSFRDWMSEAVSIGLAEWAQRL